MIWHWVRSCFQYTYLDTIRMIASAVTRLSIEILIQLANLPNNIPSSQKSHLIVPCRSRHRTSEIQAFKLLGRTKITMSPYLPEESKKICTSNCLLPFERRRYLKPGISKPSHNHPSLLSPPGQALSPSILRYLPYLLHPHLKLTQPKPMTSIPTPIRILYPLTSQTLISNRPPIKTRQIQVFNLAPHLIPNEAPPKPLSLFPLPSGLNPFPPLA